MKINSCHFEINNIKERLNGLVILVCLTLVSFGTVICNIMAHVGGPLTRNSYGICTITVLLHLRLTFAVIPKGY